MKRNKGLPDRIIRAVLAAIASVLYFAGITNGIFAMVLIEITGILLVTSFFKFCPIYASFGIKTYRKTKN